MSLKELVVELEARLSKWELGIKDIRRGLTYLHKYGYIKAADQITLLDVYNAVVAFQGLAGLKTDGEMGPKTLRVMSYPRCSLPDAHVQDGNVLTLETLEGKWGKKTLFYYIERRDSDLPPEVWDRLIATAWQQWSNVTNLTFARTENRGVANFIISTGTGRRDNFDGSGGTLAWAQLPPNNNYMGQLLTRFDTAETWREFLSSGPGILLLNVACHEFGHLLGLTHSAIRSALMAPFYNPQITKPQQRDDITRIQRLYGLPTDPPSPPDPPDPPNPPDNTIPAPSNLTAAQDSETSVVLGWKDNSLGEDFFQVYRNDEYQGAVGRGRTSAIDQQVPEGTHLYKVRAKKGTDVSDWSNIVQITLGNAPPDPPDPPDPPPEDEELVINIVGTITSLVIPGYRVTKIG